MWVDDAHHLAKHATRIHPGAPLPPYPTDLVLATLRSIRTVYHAINMTLENTTSMRYTPTSREAHLLVLHIAALRAKRCLLVYHARRVEVLRRMAWDDVRLEEDVVAASLSPCEKTFLKHHKALLSDYAMHFPGLDISGRLEPPTGELFVDVRVLKDCGEVVTEFGVVKLEVGTQHHVRREDVVQWIHSGQLLVVSNMSKS